MSLVVSCPRCGDEVTLPPEARDDALVQCPYCSEVYPFRDVRSQVPPALIVVGSVAPALDEDQSAGEFQLAAISDHTPSFVAEDEPAATRAAPQPLRARRPKAKYAGNGMMEVTKVVAGGVLGLAIGQLILWWMPGNWSVANRDPAGIGARWGQYLPGIVPPQVRGDVSSAFPMVQRSPDPAGLRDPSENLGMREGEFGRSFDSDDALGDFRAPHDTGRIGDSAGNPFTPLRDRLPRESPPEQTVGDAPEVTPAAPPPQVPEEAIEERRKETSELPSVVTQEGTPDLIGPVPIGPDPIGEAASEPTSETAEGRGNIDPVPGRTHVVRNAPRFEPAELTETLQQLKRELERWDEENSDEHARAVHTLLAQVAEAVPFTDSSQAETRTAAAELRKLLARLARDESRLASLMAIGFGTRLEDRGTLEGMMFTGVVERTESRGKLFATTFQLEDGRVTDIIGAVDPSRHLPKGQRTIVLGVFIQQPRDELAGYEGPGEPVLFGSLAVPISR